jgi:hypothetical protein
MILWCGLLRNKDGCVLQDPYIKKQFWRGDQQEDQRHLGYKSSSKIKSL